MLGNNMFAYCNNNPVNSVDSSGHLPQEKIASDRIFAYESESRFETIRLPWQDLFSGTVSVGVTYSAAMGAYVAGFKGYAIDGKGGAASVNSITTGGGTPNHGGGVCLSYTTAPTVDKLDGISGVTGGSICILGISIGFEYVIFEDDIDPSITYHGFNIILGGDDPLLPAEMHGGVSFTGIFQLWDGN